MNLNQFLQYMLPRELARAWQDSAAPVATPIAGEPDEMRTVHPGREVQLEPGWLARDAQRAAARMEQLFAEPPIEINLASLRSCRPEPSRPDPVETERMVGIVARLVYETATGLEWAAATARARGKVRRGVRAGLAEIGVVR